MASNYYSDETEVVPLLTKMKLPRFVLLEVLSSIAGERANVREGTDPPSAIGYETWRWGIRFLREQDTLRKAGWQICERHQISGIFHPDLNIKLTVLPTDRNTGTAKTPRNLTAKGPAMCKLIDENTAQERFDFLESERPSPAIWCLCPFFCELYIAAEISRPSSQIGGIVRGFSDRIVVARPFEMPGIEKRHAIPEDFADIPRPTARRKQE